MISLVKSSIVKKSVAVVASHTCQRWSILVPFVVYLALFGLVKLSSIPLRSSQAIADDVNEDEHDINVGKKMFETSDGDLKEPYALLEGIFRKVDVDKDGYLSPVELAIWINNKTQEHIHQAMMENYGLFTAIDLDPRNGVISWKEYHRYFLEQHGYSTEYLNNHDKKHSELSRRIREEIMRDKAAWSEAARSDPEHLTVDEFLAFRHPESSHATILALVEDLIEKFDRDGDDALTEEEFSTLQNDEEENGQLQNVASPVEGERRREFREAIDVSKDGKASRHELLMYIDPKNPRHGREEADNLVIMADSDHDGKLSLKEIFKKMDLFLGSKMVDTARSFHDEF